MKTQVVVVTQDGELWHAVRGEQSYLNMATMTGLHPWTGRVVDAACAADKDGNLHVLVVPTSSCGTPSGPPTDTGRQ